MHTCFIFYTSYTYLLKLQQQNRKIKNYLKKQENFSLFQETFQENKKILNFFY
jgi:hypothetical protein